MGIVTVIVMVQVPVTDMVRVKDTVTVRRMGLVIVCDNFEF